MKKLLITAIIILLIILTGITMIKGINVGKLSVLGIKDIKKEDEQLKFRKFLKISKIYGADIDLFQESDPPDIYIIDNNKN